MNYEMAIPESEEEKYGNHVVFTGDGKNFSSFQQ